MAPDTRNMLLDVVIWMDLYNININQFCYPYSNLPLIINWQLITNIEPMFVKNDIHFSQSHSMCPIDSKKVGGRLTHFWKMNIASYRFCYRIPCEFKMHQRYK